MYFLNADMFFLPVMKNIIDAYAYEKLDMLFIYEKGNTTLSLNSE